MNSYYLRMRPLVQTRAIINLYFYPSYESQVILPKLGKIAGYLFLLLLLVTNPARGDLDNGLIAHYLFNGNTDDVSGNGYHGVVHGATLVATRLNWNNHLVLNNYRLALQHKSLNCGSPQTTTISG